jgi:geranylgeranyl diphosphate synthase type I
MTEVVAVPRSAREVLAWSREEVEPALRTAVDTLPASTRHVAGYHFGWWDEKGRPGTHNGGKAIRPALTLLAWSAPPPSPLWTVSSRTSNWPNAEV